MEPFAGGMGQASFAVLKRGLVGTGEKMKYLQCRYEVLA
jgi:hypothetical protein